ncbi:MAG: PHP-associated domain-containing protein, partial [Dehalococcoidia bacterium]
VAGEEVTTQEGHLLALFIQEPLPALRPLAETIAAVHRQGGLCLVPHPLSWLTRSIGHRAIEALVRHPSDLVYLDGIELANDTSGARVSRRRARRLNQEVYHLAEVGGSDAHFLAAVGSAYTLFGGSTAQELRRCILEKTTTAVNGRHPSLAQIGAGQVLRQTWRGLTATPRTVGWLRTARSFVKLILRI